jgi:ABC-type glycerol-3-phosphate transport system permease component
MATSRSRPRLARRFRPVQVVLPLLLVLCAGAFVALLPFLYMLSDSLKTLAETITRVSALPFDPRFWPRVPQWGNYVSAWQDASFGLYFRNSVIISLTTVAGALASSSLAAYGFARLHFPGRDALFALLLATLIIPETVLLIPNFIIVSRFGWINRLPALTVPFMGSAFYIFLLRQFFAQIPGEFIDSALLEGATHLRVFLSIVLPLARAPLVTVMFLAFTAAWNALQWPLVVTETPRWRPITVGLASFISQAGPLTQLRMAGSVITIVPVLGVYFLAQRQFTEAITRSSLQG